MVTKKWETLCDQLLRGSLALSMAPLGSKRLPDLHIRSWVERMKLDTSLMQTANSFSTELQTSYCFRRRDASKFWESF
jgi:hypothetical protein